MQLLPPSPLKTPESENNEPCHHPGNSIWPGNSTRGKRKGWGHTVSAPAQTGRSGKFGAKENKFKVTLELASPQRSLVHPQTNLFVD